MQETAQSVDKHLDPETSSRAVPSPGVGPMLWSIEPSLQCRRQLPWRWRRASPSRHEATGPGDDQRLLATLPLQSGHAQGRRETLPARLAPAHDPAQELHLQRAALPGARSIDPQAAESLLTQAWAPSNSARLRFQPNSADPSRSFPRAANPPCRHRKALSLMKVLIAGAAGAIGRQLVRCLNQNHTVFALSSPPEASRAVATLDAEPVAADALDAASVKAVIARVRPTPRRRGRMRAQSEKRCRLLLRGASHERKGDHGRAVEDAGRAIQELDQAIRLQPTNASTLSCAATPTRFEAITIAPSRSTIRRSGSIRKMPSPTAS